ncbi:MAG: two-component system, NarL family, sensor kinase, partial [Actinomycetota bacterium]|nr:two-component system, NarL family, sensor kinase [Actinomycetota bacterium]
LQYLAAATFACDNARTLLEDGRDVEARDVMGTAGNAVGEAIKVLRESLVDLRGSLVEQGGLVETARQFAAQASTLWGVDVNVEGMLEIEPPAPVALAAVQIIQEGLNNALKHAQADSITVKIDDTDGMIRIVVQDRGVGFDPNAHVGDDHLGLGLMKERAHQLGADISLESAPGEGTRLEAVFPGAIRS